MLQVKRFQFFSHWWRCSMMAGMATWGSSSNPIQIDTLPLDTDSVWWVDGDGDGETQEQHVVADPYSEPSPEPLENVFPTRNQLMTLSFPTRNQLMTLSSPTRMSILRGP